MATNRRTGASWVSGIRGRPFGSRSRAAVYVFSLPLFVLAFTLIASAECVAHPEQRTATQFKIETSYELTFFVDEDESGASVVPKALTAAQTGPSSGGTHSVPEGWSAGV